MWIGTAETATIAFASRGQWIDVPDDRVITEPNRAGRTIVWPYYINGHPFVRCFIPGTMT